MAIVMELQHFNIPRSKSEIKAPQFPIVIIYPGTSPQDLEDLVVDPIEKKVSNWKINGSRQQWTTVSLWSWLSINMRLCRAKIPELVVR